MSYVGVRQPEGFVVHEQPDHLAVGHIQHGLAGSRKTIRFLAVNDGPRFIEPVDERAVLDRGTSLSRERRACRDSRSPTP
jgi:hypothetical protein